MEKSPEKIVAELRNHFQKEEISNGSEIARLTGIGQPSVHRALYGKKPPVRITKTLRELCTYANVDLTESPTEPLPQNIRTAVLQLWDGTEEDAARIADLLLALRAYRLNKQP